MRLTEMPFPDGLPIDGYGPGFFRIGGEVHRGAIILSPEGVRPWGGLDDRAPLMALAGRIDVLLVGTGRVLVRAPAELAAAAEAAGFGLEPMASDAAARTYNVLLAEGRRIAVALLPVA
ncbi:Mth938-like domain-containing protein [Albidovulum sp.]